MERKLYKILAKFGGAKNVTAVQANEAEKLLNQLIEQDEDQEDAAVQLVNEIFQMPIDELSREDYQTLVALIQEISSQQEFALPVFKEPPLEDIIEYGDPETDPNRKRVIRIDNDGNYYEVDMAGNDIGPLTSNHEPAEGHPEYGQSFVNDFSESFPDLDPGYELPDFGQVQDLIGRAQDLGFLESPVQVRQLASPQAHMQSYQQRATPQVQNIHLDTDIGTILYQPVQVVQRRRCVALYFDTASGAPPLFIPHAGYTCNMVHGDKIFSVMYTGSLFEDPFNPEMTILVFTVLD